MALESHQDNKNLGKRFKSSDDWQLIIFIFKLHSVILVFMEKIIYDTLNVIIISEIVHVFFIRENSPVNLNLHHFLVGREDSICRYCLGTFTSFHFTFDVVVHFFFCTILK